MLATFLNHLLEFFSMRTKKLPIVIMPYNYRAVDPSLTEDGELFWMQVQDELGVASLPLLELQCGPLVYVKYVPPEKVYSRDLERDPTLAKLELAYLFCERRTRLDKQVVNPRNRNHVGFVREFFPPDCPPLPSEEARDILYNLLVGQGDLPRAAYQAATKSSRGRATDLSPRRAKLLCVSTADFEDIDTLERFVISSAKKASFEPSVYRFEVL